MYKGHGVGVRALNTLGVFRDVSTRGFRARQPSVIANHRSYVKQLQPHLAPFVIKLTYARDGKAVNEIPKRMMFVGRLGSCAEGLRQCSHGLHGHYACCRNLQA